MAFSFKLTPIICLILLFSLSACGQNDEPSICTMTPNQQSAKDHFNWQGTYTERIDCEKGKGCGQVRQLTLNADETFSYGLVTNGKSQYLEKGKFTWEDNGNIVNIGRYSFYLNKDAAAHVFEHHGNKPKFNQASICLLK